MEIDKPYAATQNLIYSCGFHCEGHELLSATGVLDVNIVAVDWTG